jgi:hypothetical protein
MFTVFNWKMDQEVDSAFLAFDLVGRDTGFQCERDPDVSSSQNLVILKKRSGLSAEKRNNEVPTTKASPNSTGRTESFLQPDPS